MWRWPNQQTYRQFAVIWSTFSPDRRIPFVDSKQSKSNGGPMGKTDAAFKMDWAFVRSKPIFNMNNFALEKLLSLISSLNLEWGWPYFPLCHIGFSERTKQNAKAPSRMPFGLWNYQKSTQIAVYPHKSRPTTVGFVPPSFIWFSR